MQKTFVFLSIKAVAGKLVSIGATTSTGKNAYLFISDNAMLSDGNDTDKMVLRYKDIPLPMNLEEHEFESGSLFQENNFYGKYPSAEIKDGLNHFAQWIVNFGPLAEIWLEEISTDLTAHIFAIKSAIEQHVSKLPAEHRMKAIPFPGHSWNALVPIMLNGKNIKCSHLAEDINDRISLFPIIFHPIPNEQDVVRYPKNLMECLDCSNQALYAAIILREAFAKTFNIPIQFKENKESKPVPISPINPGYYREGQWEMIEFIEDQGLDYVLGNAVRIIIKSSKKDPHPEKVAESLQKALWYIDRCINQCAIGQRQQNSRAAFISPEEFCKSAKLSELQTTAITKICAFQQIHGKDFLHHVNLLHIAQSAILSLISKITTPLQPVNAD